MCKNCDDKIGRYTLTYNEKYGEWEIKDADGMIHDSYSMRGEAVMCAKMLERIDVLNERIAELDKSDKILSWRVSHLWGTVKRMI